MALHLNFYHEVLEQRRQRKRDPMRFALAGGIVLALLATSYYFYRLQTVRGVAAQADKLRNEWTSIEPQQKKAKEIQDSILENQKLVERLTDRIERRFHWGPVLQRLLEAVPAEVQLTRLEAESAPDTARPFQLTITGLSAGSEPRTVAEELRTTVAAKFASETGKTESTFQTLEESDQLVQINGKSFPTALFTITVQRKQDIKEEPPAQSKPEEPAEVPL
jgi:Tfp pilus assembly protein PilN